MKKGIWCVLLILMLLPVIAENDQYHLKLLAVQENGEDFTGSDADLLLELKEGSGRVFLDTFPLTKLDTQISTRFAKEIACDHFKLNCAKYDFIYTIKAKTNIIGGPSAGAAIAALTAIAVLDLDYDKSVSITGTINSGGIVGPVGGLKEKIEAAADANLKTVLITTGTSIQEKTTNNTNVTNKLDLVKYGKNNLSLKIIEVIDLDEVVFQFTGKDLNHKNFKIVENNEYTKIMKKLKEVLCGRYEKMKEEILEDDISLNENNTERIAKKRGKAENASKAKDYYSAASFCFGANIDLKTEFYKEEELENRTLKKLFRLLEKKVNKLEEKLDAREIESISDLQTLIVVKERINDVRYQLDKRNSTNIENSYAILAYAEERYFSAISWMQFFSMPGKKFTIKDELLENSCIQKISEAEERFQYVSLFIPSLNIKEKIDTARLSLNEKEFALCLITAAQAKADANAILSSIGLGNNETINVFLESKNKAAERVIAENSAEGIFPILGYSYYQYANSLKEQDKFTALVYLEYALEMSQLDMYFPERKEFRDKKFSIKTEYWYLIIGLIVGFAIAVFMRKPKKQTERWEP